MARHDTWTRVVVRRGTTGSPLNFVRGDRMTAEDIAWLFERLTGRPCTMEELEDCRRQLQTVSAEQATREGKSDGGS